jgi:hypothetical protein
MTHQKGGSSKMARPSVRNTPTPNPDELTGVTESGKAFFGLSLALVFLAIIVLAFVLTTC